MSAPATPIAAREPKLASWAEDLAKDYISTLEKRAAGQTDHVPSGLPAVDKVIGKTWLSPGRLIILAARPRVGKSAMAQQLCEAVAQNKTTLYVSLEMSGMELIERSISRRSGVSVNRLREADNLKEVDYSGIGGALKGISGLNFLVDSRSSCVEEILNKTRAIARALQPAGRPPLGLVVIDYVQLIAGDRGRHGNREQEIAGISRGLKLLAKELNIPIVAISQLNRAVENRPNKRPDLADLRDSGTLEQDADLILFLYRDELYNPETTDKGKAEIICRKNRHGPDGTAFMGWVGEKMEFCNVEALPTLPNVQPAPSAPGRKSKRGLGNLAGAGADEFDKRSRVEDTASEEAPEDLSWLK